MNPNCPDKLKKLVPLSKVVNASIIDVYGDIGTVQQLHFHWAARGLKKLQSETLKSGKRSALITVNQNTRTASLPPDFDEELFVGYIEHGKKIPIPLRTNLVNDLSIEDIPCEDVCPVCQQDKAICNDLTVTETVELVNIVTGNCSSYRLSGGRSASYNYKLCGQSAITSTTVPDTTPYITVCVESAYGVVLTGSDGGATLVGGCDNGTSTYEKTTIKKLYPNGDYFLEQTIPYWDIANNAVAYAQTKEFIAHIDLKDCGCVETTAENIETIRNCCYDCYCSHFTPCGQCDHDAGGYAIFENTGQIQFDFKFRHKKVYLEYRGFIPKLNGQLAVPEVAFETLVEYTKAMSLDGKKNVSNNDKAWRWGRYSIERKAMVKVMNRLSLDDIIYAINLTPKFDWTAPSWNDFCPVSTTQEVPTLTNAAITGCDPMPACSTTASPVRTPFRLAVKVPVGVVTGLPVAGQSTWQNDFLIGAINLDYLIYNDALLSKNLGKFTFDSATGTIDISPNIFFEDDSIIADFFKMV